MGICIGFSAITFVVSFIMKLIPLEILIDKWIKPKEEIEEDIKEELVNDIKIVSINDVGKVPIGPGRGGKRLGTNRLFNRGDNKRNTIGSKLSLNKNLSQYN